MSAHLLPVDLPAAFTGMVPITVFLASLAGSLHCVGMCGGLVAGAGRDPRGLVNYHFGRLLIYLLLGAASGGLGRALLGSSWLGLASWISTGLVSVLFCWMGWRIYRGGSLHVSWFPSRWLERGFRISSGSFWVGIMTGLLPCGWLHGFLLAAVASQSAVAGAVTLFAFWLGTLPALSAGPVLLSRLVSSLKPRGKQWAGLLLVGAALFNVGSKAVTALQAPGSERSSCHAQAQSPSSSEAHPHPHSH